LSDKRFSISVCVSLLFVFVSFVSERFHYLTISIFAFLLFLPMIGHGFIHDDFVHLFSVAYDPLWSGLTKANGGPFYTPLAWLTFKIDWVLWGWKPMAFAVVNLILHVTNIILLYHLTLSLYRSVIAARWAATGFALLYPANTWAMMWISTRAHIIVTLFYLATLLATVWYARTERHKVPAICVIVLFATSAIFSKESGVTIPAAIALVLLNERISRKQNHISVPSLIGLFTALAAILLVYARIRAQSGAIPITFSENQWYTYIPSLPILLENALRYGWRTYGLLTIIAGAIALSLHLRRHSHCLRSVTRNDVLFSLMLFNITIAPFILLPGRSGIYSYLPGTAAALLLGVAARSMYELKPLSRANLITRSPIVLTIIIYGCLTVGHSLKWKQMAEVSGDVLQQIVTQQPKPTHNMSVILTYSHIDKENSFPDAISWGFPYALRVLYADPTLDGLIIRQGAQYCNNCNRLSEIHFVYECGNNGEPRVIPAIGRSDDPSLNGITFPP
jgi:hypothetical protein